MLLSIIIPVYNVEKYVKECVESIENRNINDIEIILVDDGSTDLSGIICDELQLNFNNIKVIHKKNGGLSSARNEGIKKSIGEYLIFIDSDDYIDKNENFNNLLEHISKNNTDVTLYRSKDFNICKNTVTIAINEYNTSIKDKDEFLKELFKRQNFPGSACIICVKRDFIKKNDLYFKENIKSEDIEWIIRLICSAHDISAINDVLYVYRKYRSGSITNSGDSKHVKDIIQIIKDSIILIEKNIDEQSLKNSFYDYFAYIISTSFVYASNVKIKELIELEELYNEIIYIFRYAEHLNTRLVRIFLKIFGIKNTIKFVHFIYIKKRG